MKVKVMIAIFDDICLFSAKNGAFLKNANFLPKIGENR
jgi:hypothetical protein